MVYPWSNLGFWRHGIFEMDRRLRAGASDDKRPAGGQAPVTKSPGIATPAVPPEADPPQNVAKYERLP